MSEKTLGEVKPVPGFDGYYVSDTGRVFNSLYHGRYGVKVLYPPRELAQQREKNGYMKVTLWQKGKGAKLSVHRLVLLAFVGECPENCEASHIDGVRHNNIASNLVWETRKENHRRKIAHGTYQGGARSNLAKYSEETVKGIKRHLAQGFGATATARVFGVSQGMVRWIQQGGWAHVQ